jgi:hypothetical protein
MIHLLADFAQVFFWSIPEFLNFFYSFSYKDLSAFRVISKIGIFVKSAQVRANYRGTREAGEPLRGRLESGAGEQLKNETGDRR